MDDLDKKAKAPHLLLILDGWGYREATDNNAIAQANTPVWDLLWQERPHTLLDCSGKAVGLPTGQMGSSEVGHMHLGAGRIVHQELALINEAVASGALESNAVLCQTMQKLASQPSAALHVFGLLSPGGVHSHEDHIQALVKLAAKQSVKRIFVHAFLDGRDTPPRSAEASIRALVALCEQCSSAQNSEQAPEVRLVSLCGRYFAMDRDANFERTELAYRLLTEGVAMRRASTALDGLKAAYHLDQTDEFIEPVAIHADDEPAIRIVDGDAVVFMNFRADRARQLSRAFVDPAFSGFQRRLQPKLASFTTLTRYADDIPADVAFAPRSLPNTLGEYLADAGQTQLRIAETEKYAHVTFFFSGGREQAYAGEERILIPSPKVATYDQQPAMSAHEVTDAVVQAVQFAHHDLIVCNFANTDMVGHTGMLDAAMQAVETVDTCIGRILQAFVDVPGHCLITADHGNAEQMLDDKNNQPHTAHTCAQVPLLYASGQSRGQLRSSGSLVDVAPTLLSLMQLSQPPEMTGRSLFL